MVVSDWSTVDWGEGDVDIELFDTYEKAKSYFDDCVAEEKENDSLCREEFAEIEEEDNYFSVCEDGNFISNHYTIRIVEKEVL